jgi:hypothetical protein
MTDIRQSVQYANYLSSIGWKVERLADINYFIKKLPLIGSVIKVQRPPEIRTDTINKLSRKYRALQIIIEPKNRMDAEFLTSIGYKLSKLPYLPTKTLQLDLTKSNRAIVKDLKKDARSALRKSQNSKIQEITNLGMFREKWKKAVGLKRYITPTTHLMALKKSFKKNVLFLADTSNASGAIFLYSDKIAYYWQAFTDKAGRKNLSQYKIVWEGLVWAKKRGARIFDFEGIFDRRFPNKTWLGFTHFKKSFGGYEVGYPGCVVKSKLSL